MASATCDHHQPQICKHNFYFEKQQKLCLWPELKSTRSGGPYNEFNLNSLRRTVFDKPNISLGNGLASYHTWKSILHMCPTSHQWVNCEMDSPHLYFSHHNAKTCLKLRLVLKYSTSKIGLWCLSCKVAQPVDKRIIKCLYQKSCSWNRSSCGSLMYWAPKHPSLRTRQFEP